MGICIIMNSADNVATVLQKTAPGDVLSVVDCEMDSLGTVSALEDILFAHKISIRYIPTGGEVNKFGIAIGRATAEIPVGCCAHIHNVISIEGAEKVVKDRVPE